MDLFDLPVRRLELVHEPHEPRYQPMKPQQPAQLSLETGEIKLAKMAPLGRAGYFNYYAVPGSLDSLAVFRDRVLGLWWHGLRRRSQKHPFSWARTLALGDRWLPQPRVLHPYPAV